MKVPTPVNFAALLASFGAVAVAHPAPPADHVRHEARDTGFDHMWVKRERMDNSLYVPVRVGLTQSNLEKGAEMLMDISHPASPNFGEHLSKQEVGDLFAPTSDRVHAVSSWLSSSISGGSDRVVLSPSRQWLQINATIAELEDLLHTTYHEYEHAETGKTVLGCDEYHVPHHVREHLDFITPGVTTLELRKRGAGLRKRDSRVPHKPLLTKVPNFSAQTANGTSNCDYAVTPTCVHALYNITDTLQGNTGNSIGIYENQDQTWNQTDLNSFFTVFAPQIPQGTHPVYDAIDGAPPPGPQYYVGGEADLDFQAVYPLVYPDKIVNFQTDDTYWETVGANDITGLFNTFLDAIDKSYCNYSAYGVTGDTPGVDPTYPDKHKGGYDHPEQCGVFAPTNVLSLSWSIDEDILPLNYQLRQCNEWMKLALQGVTVFFASGDSGVAPSTGICSRNNTIFGAQSPVDCPWVTAVGATYLPPGGIPGKTPESATTKFPSSGGFSNIFTPPSYQSSALNSYFQKYPPPYPYYNITHNATHTTGLYNRGGRGYPDVSAVGQNFAIFYESAGYQAAGTSVSTPLWAGMVARINSARMDAGKGPIGFLNPILYSHPDLFNDITSGSNPGCGTDGFEAVEGWDPVTGLGTPNYGKLKSILMSLK